MNISHAFQIPGQVRIYILSFMHVRIRVMCVFLLLLWICNITVVVAAAVVVFVVSSALAIVIRADVSPLACKSKAIRFL